MIHRGSRGGAGAPRRERRREWTDISSGWLYRARPAPSPGPRTDGAPRVRRRPGGPRYKGPTGPQRARRARRGWTGRPKGVRGAGRARAAALEMRAAPPRRCRPVLNARGPLLRRGVVRGGSTPLLRSRPLLPPGRAQSRLPGTRRRGDSGRPRAGLRGRARGRRWTRRPGPRPASLSSRPWPRPAGDDLRRARVRVHAGPRAWTGRREAKVGVARGASGRTCATSVLFPSP